MSDLMKAAITGGRRLLSWLVILAIGVPGIAAQSAQAQYVSPQFFGQHLMWFYDLTPQIPVHAMRLWDSNTLWCQIDNGTASGQYDFGQLDAMLGQASRLGADVEFTFGGTPTWAVTGSYPQPAVTDQCDWNMAASRPPANESSWINFVTALVTNAKGKINAYELWNEADYAPYWSGSVAQMVKMSVDAAAIIHRIDPSALVLSPSITATQEGYTFLHQYLSQLPAGTINRIAVHSYTNGMWPEQAVPTEINSVRAALPAAYATTPIWSTEGGWGTNSQFSSVAADQSAFVARYDLMMLKQGVARNYWYAYPNTQWGTLWNGTALTPAGIATKSIENWLSGATLNGCSTGDNNFWTCNLTTSTGAQARIVWATSWAVWYQTTGYRTVRTLQGTSTPATGWLQVLQEPILLTG
jgi:hypothetical protein